jgi:hypothetical protein
LVPFDVCFGTPKDAYSQFLKMMESMHSLVPSGVWTDSSDILEIEANEFGTGEVGDEVAVVDVVRMVYE